MKTIVKSALIVFAVTTLPLAAQAADSDKASKGWPSFKKIDADNSGAISMDEARTVTGLAENFSPYDKNGDGQLSKSEYESARKAQKSGKSSSGASGSSSRSSGGSSAAGDSSGAAGAGSSSGSGSSGSGSDASGSR